MSANRLVRAPPRLPNARFVGRTAYLEPGDSINAAIEQLAPTMASPATIQLAPGLFIESVPNTMFQTMQIVMPAGLTLVGHGRSQTVIDGYVACYGSMGGTADTHSLTIKDITILGSFFGIETNGYATVVVENVELSGATAAIVEILQLTLVVKGLLHITSAASPCARLLCPVRADPASKIVVVYNGVATNAVGLDLVSTIGEQSLGTVRLHDCSMLIDGENNAEDELQEIRIEHLDVFSQDVTTSVSALRIDLENVHIRINNMHCERPAALLIEPMIKAAVAQQQDVYLALGQVKWTVRGAVNTNMFGGGITNLVTNAPTATVYTASLQ